MYPTVRISPYRFVDGVRQGPRSHLPLDDDHRAITGCGPGDDLQTGNVVGGKGEHPGSGPAKSRIRGVDGRQQLSR